MSISLPGIGNFDLSTVGSDVQAVNTGLFSGISSDLGDLGQGIGNGAKGIFSGTISGLGGTKFLLIAGGCVVLFLLLK